jgi:uncharacterized protein with ACT and thioredoxin-like domain
MKYTIEIHGRGGECYIHLIDDEQKETLIERLSQLNSEEIKVGKEFQEKYGEGSIDIAKGEFTRFI